jgi:hypothetical protein
LSGSTVSNSLWFFIVAWAHELSGSTVSNSLWFFIVAVSTRWKTFALWADFTLSCLHWWAFWTFICDGCNNQLKFGRRLVTNECNNQLKCRSRIVSFDLRVRYDCLTLLSIVGWLANRFATWFIRWIAHWLLKSNQMIDPNLISNKWGWGKSGGIGQ